MSEYVMSEEQVKKIVDKFLKNNFPKYKDNELYIGEMLTSAFMGLSKYDNTISSNPERLINKYCWNRMNKLMENDKRFYSRHKFSFNLDSIKYYDSETLEQTLEQCDLLNLTCLSNRCKEIIKDRITYLDDKFANTASRCKISKQTVYEHLKYYRYAIVKRITKD